MRNTLIIVSLLFLCACGGGESNKNEAEKSETQKEQNILAVENYYFAIKEQDNYRQYNKAIYHRGDEIFLLMNNVGKFARDADSLNNANMSMEVKDAVGQTVISRKDLFGKKGHADFKNDVLKKPYVSYESSAKNKPGKYSIKVTIYDLVKNDSIVIEDDFYIE